MTLAEAMLMQQPSLKDDALFAYMVEHPEAVETLLPVLVPSTLQLLELRRLAPKDAKRMISRIARQVGKQKLGYYDGRD